MNRGTLVVMETTARTGLTDAERAELSVWDVGVYACACVGSCPSLPCNNQRDDLFTTVERIIVEREGCAS